MKGHMTSSDDTIDRLRLLASKLPVKKSIYNLFAFVAGVTDHLHISPVPTI